MAAYPTAVLEKRKDYLGADHYFPEKFGRSGRAIACQTIKAVYWFNLQKLLYRPALFFCVGELSPSALYGVVWRVDENEWLARRHLALQDNTKSEGAQEEEHFLTFGGEPRGFWKALIAFPLPLEGRHEPRLSV